MDPLVAWDLEIPLLSPIRFVEVAERPGSQYNWEILADEQAELRARFGSKRSHADPDLRVEFNCHADTDWLSLPGPNER